MKKTLMLVLAALVVLFTAPSFAQQGSKGASAQAYEHASDEAVFNRVGDWFATIGKSEEEKAAIKAQRRAEREAKRIEKEAKKKAQQAEEEMEKQKKNINEKMKGLGK